MNKTTELCRYIDAMEEKPDIIAITEVKPKNSRYGVTKAELQIEGYSMYTKNLECNEGRGIVIYLREQLSATPITGGVTGEEQLWLELRLDRGDKLAMGCIPQPKPQHAGK